MVLFMLWNKCSFVHIKLTIMKKLLFPLLFLVTVMSACKKDDPAPEPPVDLSGTTFKGTAVIGGISYDPFKLQFNANGTAVVTIGNFTPFPGQWNKTPNSSIVYFFFDENATTTWKGQGTLNSANNKLEGGTVTRLTPSTIAGTFTADKQ
jgi:hypothetical protein